MTQTGYAQVYEDAAAVLRALEAPAPEHTDVFTALASWMDSCAQEARQFGYDDDWSGYDEPGFAGVLRELAHRITTDPVT